MGGAILLAILLGEKTPVLGTALVLKEVLVLEEALVLEVELVLQVALVLDRDLLFWAAF